MWQVLLRLFLPPHPYLLKSLVDLLGGRAAVTRMILRKTQPLGIEALAQIE